MNEDNLIPLNKRTKEEQREIARKGGIKSGEVRREKKLMTEIYLSFLEKEHDVIGKDGNKKKMNAQELVNHVMSKVLSRGDSASVRMLQELRETLEGSKVHVTSEGVKRLVDYAAADNVDNAAKQYEEDQEIEEQEGKEID